ncbi:MAG: GNAT family N-acetyltransferase [Candidatus Cloacimonetes bacterium]|nr:GNAT family N-acetyltransferase [Candidatus Cloacimonadota bacterium]
MIEGSNVNLRLFRESDLEEYYSYVSKLSEIGEYWPRRLNSFSSMQKQFQENGFWSEVWGKMLITDKEDRMLGNINYFKGIPYVDGYEIGYRIFRPEGRGRGYTTEAVNLFVDYFFSIYPIQRLQAGINPANTGSRRVLEKCGFQKEGRLRKAYFHRGEYFDVELYSLIRGELK